MLGARSGWLRVLLQVELDYEKHAYVVTGPFAFSVLNGSPTCLFVFAFLLSHS